MKKQNSIITIAIIIASIFFNGGCKTTTTTPPIITVYGANPEYVTLNSSYSDSGANASDVTDGDISWKIVTTYYPSTGVNFNLAGTYYAYYNVSDAAGNQAAQAIRTIYVYNSANTLAGNYSGSILYPGSPVRFGSDSISASSTINFQMMIYNFALNPKANIIANFDSTLKIISIPKQAVGDTIYWGSGIRSNTTLVIIYSDSSISSGVILPNLSSTYTKQ
jgi:hypothetical protein